MTQTTQYPTENTTKLEFSPLHPETFTVYVRIPEWAGAKSVVSVNGNRSGNEVTPENSWRCNAPGKMVTESKSK